MNSNLEFFAGEDRSYTITITDGDGIAINITGYTIWFTVKADPEDTDVNALIQKEITSHTTPASGITTITLTNDDTNIALGNHFYDIQMMDSSSLITTLVAGRVRVKRRITQDNA